jgi:hypothetical protein
MPGQAIQVGPFVGGLNTFSDPSAIADNELVVCENFEIDLDGSLKSRPPIEDTGISFTLGATGNINILGYFYDQNGVEYLIASDGLTSTYYFTGSTWVLISNTLSAAGFTQFDDKAWLTAPVGTTQVGGYWTPSVVGLRQTQTCLVVKLLSRLKTVCGLRKVKIQPTKGQDCTVPAQLQTQPCGL